MENVICLISSQLTGNVVRLISSHMMLSDYSAVTVVAYLDKLFQCHTFPSQNYPLDMYSHPGLVLDHYRFWSDDEYHYYM